MPSALRILAAVVAAAILVGLLAWGMTSGPEAPSARVEAAGDRAIEFPAVVTADAFDRAGDMAGYHFIVWSEGGAADAALLRARVGDVEVIRALEALGAEPGDALDIDSWDERHDEGSEAPDRFIQGPRVEIAILVPGRGEPLSLAEILEDPGGRGFDMRFGGHEDNIPAWHSGCVVCLYSCPGSKVGNAAYTVRDFVAGATRFAVRPGVLPADGTEVTVRLTWVGGPGRPGITGIASVPPRVGGDRR